ncbi:MAG: pantoate--beta-alanine ligase [Desulfocapsa sp.]|nr:pantoate--beta-alanine ligase [Desulfocapsa sp.]
MNVITSPDDVQFYSQRIREQGLTIGLVPTMGWFHSGHLALMDKAKRLADKVIVTLFVNPMQFGPSEDLENYPHDFDRDCRLAEELGVDLLYAPEKESMYPDGFATTVHVKGLTTGLCGGDRPGHFDGVTTVVAKLFNQTLPHLAVFGEKDFQQLAVIRKMVQDLDFPIEIVGHPIVREESGLAMSSRNTYLKKDEMAAALSLSQGIACAREMVGRQDTVTVGQIKDAVSAVILRHPQCTIDYVEVIDENSLMSTDTAGSDSRLLLAVKINNRIRLIDNSTLFGKERI